MKWLYRNYNASCYSRFNNGYKMDHGNTEDPNNLCNNGTTIAFKINSGFNHLPN